MQKRGEIWFSVAKYGSLHWRINDGVQHKSSLQEQHNLSKRRVLLRKPSDLQLDWWAAVVYMLSSWLLEQGSGFGPCSRHYGFFGEWVSPASKSQYDWNKCNINVKKISMRTNTPNQGFLQNYRNLFSPNFEECTTFWILKFRLQTFHVVLVIPQSDDIHCFYLHNIANGIEEKTILILYLFIFTYQ